MKIHFIHHHEGDDSLQDLLTTGSKSQTCQIRKVVMIGCAVNAFLMVMKLTVGWLGHSDALFADGFHSLNDMAVDLVMLFFVGISYKHATRRYAYGYGKFETFSSFLISVMMIVIATLIGIEGVESIISYARGATLPHPDLSTVIAIVIAICCKEGLYHYYNSRGLKYDSMALRAAGLHHRIDALASVATMIGVVCAHFFGEKMRVFDPIASVIIAVTILFPAVRLLIRAFKELTDATLSEADLAKATEAVRKVAGVKDVLSLKGRRSGHSRIFDVSVKVAPGTPVEESAKIVKQVKGSLCDAFCPHAQTTVEVS